MKTYFFGAFALMMACTVCSQSSDFAGHWVGRLNANEFPVDIVMHVNESPDGNFSCVIDIPGQFEDYKADTTYLSSDTLIFEWLLSQTAFKGVLESEDRMQGTWSTRGNVSPILFERSADGIYRRPQEPRGKPAYEVQEVSFTSASDPNVTLAGTLTLPKGIDVYPAVVLITGSGAQDRNEAVHGHKPFLVLADRLTKAGIAVLRFDDRGTAKSTGSYEGATTEDFANDALGAVAFLKNQDLPITRIGLMGHTEGGSAGMIAASENSDIAFLILLATVGIKHEDLLVSQTVSALSNAGTAEHLIRIDTQYTRKLYRNMNTWSPDDPDTSAVRSLLSDFYDQSDLIKTRFRNFETFYERQMDMMTTPWFHFYATFDPAEYLSKVSCPVLALNGSDDIQVVADTNLEAIERILTKSKKSFNHKIMKLDGLNHYFQPAEGEYGHEYALIMTTFDESAMQAINDWILYLNQ